MEPTVETETGKGMDRESGTERKSATGGIIQKGRAERMTGTIDGNFVTGDSVSFWWEVSGAEMLSFVRRSVTLTAAGCYCSARKARNHTRSPRRERECNS
jgi:hypothetical protein